jgi:hypothetical protein
MLMLRSKQGQIRCKKGQTICTTITVALQVTDCTNGGARLRFVAVEVDGPHHRTPHKDRYALRKGQKFLIDPSMVLTVIGCQSSPVRLEVRADANDVTPSASIDQTYFTPETERG